MIWKLAWRNLWRHRARTLIMGSAVAFLYGLTLVGIGINDDAHRRMLEEATATAGGGCPHPRSRLLDHACQRPCDPARGRDSGAGR